MATGTQITPFSEMAMVEFIDQMRGDMGGLFQTFGPPPAHPLQVGRMADAECGCVVPTHCFRSVSQRSLNTITRFSSQVVTVAANNNQFDAVVGDAGTGAIPDISILGSGANPNGFIFNDANNQQERGRLNDLVCIALRVNLQVMVLDAEAVGAGSIDLAAHGAYLENLIASNVYISMYHLADKRDPWFDQTDLQYFRRDRRFWPIPPLKWIDRDPAMALSLRPIDFGTDTGLAIGTPDVLSSVRALDLKLDLAVEALFVPDPEACGDYWPGTICPPNTIGNTPGYTGMISTAKRAA